MTSRSPAILAVGVLLVAALAAGAAAGPSTETSYPEHVAIADPATAFVPGELLVRFRAGVSPTARAAALESLGAERVRDLSLPGTVLARLPAGKRVEAAAAAVAKRADVAYSEPNWIYRAAATPNDPDFANGHLWSLFQANDIDVDATEAWNTTVGSPDVVIAIVDSGIAYDHPDLEANIWTNEDETPGNGVDDDGNGHVDDVRGWNFVENDNDTRDTLGHGTAVAGTIGARGNNGIGIAGVNWNVSLMPVRVLGTLGATAAELADGLAYAAANGADIVNVSLAGPGFSQTMEDVIDGNPETLFVAPAGNGGNDLVGDDNEVTPQYPCNYTSANLICVASTTKTDALDPTSNFGTASVDLGAPGQFVHTTWIAWDELLLEDFESDAGWTGGGSPNTWARTAEAGWMSSWSAADSPGGNYENNTSNWFQPPNPVDLSGRIGCTVGFVMMMATEFPHDRLVLEVSTDGATWTELGAWSGTAGIWGGFGKALKAYEGHAAVRFRLGLKSNESVTAAGANIDRVVVRCVSTNRFAFPYTIQTGTSMAAAHVSGVAGLAWAKNPAASVAEVRAAILEGGDATAAMSGKTVTGRRLNAAGALALIPQASLPPDTAVSGPVGTWARPSASFELSSLPAGGSFECRLNGGAWSACSSPFEVATVVPGRYEYEFRAVNAVGVDATPASAALRVVRPFLADWDADGTADQSVWRPAVGGWHVLGAPTSWFGLNGDVPVPGQWDADPEPDRAVWRPAVGAWFVEGSAAVYHGAPDDVPVPADWNGDGVLEHIVWRPDHGGWYVRGVGTFYWGARGDVPVLGDYDADPELDLAVYRDGSWYVEGSPTVFHGLAGDVPVPADWDGDGKTDIAVYRPSNSTWYIRNISTTPFGISGDVPLVGYFDPDPAIDRAVWRPAAGGWYVEGAPRPSFFGLPTDIP